MMTCKAGHVRAAQECQQLVTNELQNSAVYTHLKDTGHKINLTDIIILDREDKYFERGIR